MINRQNAVKYAIRMALISIAGFMLTISAFAADQAEKLTLEDSVRIALEKNPAVQIARENVVKANASINEAFSAGMPKVSIDGTYQRADKAVNFGDIPVGSLVNRSANLTVAQPIDVFGVIKTGKQAANFGKASFQYGSDQQTNDTIFDTKVAFYNVLRAQQYLKVQQDTVSQLNAHLEDTKANFAAGTIAKFDVLRAETQLANAQQGLISAQNGVELSKSVFNNVLGRSLDTPVDLVEPKVSEFVNLELQTCVDSACRWRPEVLRADSTIGLSDKMVKIARLSGKPRFNFRWSYNKAFDITTFNPNDTSWKAFFLSSLNLYDGGATRAAVQKAESDARNAKTTREQIVQGINLDAQQSYLTVKESQERITAATKGLEQATEALRLAQVRYKEGMSTQIEVLDSQTAYTLADTNYVNALYDYQVALAKLERAVGGQVQMAKLLEDSKRAKTLTADERR